MMPSVRIGFYSVLLTAFVACGCKKPVATQSDPVQAPSRAAPQAVKPADQALFKSATATTPQQMARLLTDALTTWEDQRGGVPQSLDQLVQARILDRLPTPPPGFKFAIDAQKHEVKLVPQ